jgi:hypothetical protein
MAEDWRLTVRLAEDGHAARLLALLHTHELRSQARDRLGERIAVSGSGDHVFLYAGTEAAAREAEQIVSGILDADRLRGELRLERWHHAEERWEDARVALPSTPAQERAEHAVLERQEAAEARATGWAEWELRIEFASHADAVAFARRLEPEGFTHLVRRSRFLLVGTVDRDEADAVARRLAAELPDGARIHEQPGSGLVWEVMPHNPFAVFGGLGG